MTVHEIPAGYDGTIGEMDRRMRRNPAGPAATRSAPPRSS